MKIKIIDKGKTKRAVSPEFAAKVLGAEDMGAMPGALQGPISVLAVRQIIADRLRSTGGRPKLMGAETVRRKISVIEDDWNKLEKLAAYYRETQGLNVTSGQVAVALIHAGISRIDKKKIKM